MVTKELGQAAEDEVVQQAFAAGSRLGFAITTKAEQYLVDMLQVLGCFFVQIQVLSVRRRFVGVEFKGTKFAVFVLNVNWGCPADLLSNQTVLDPKVHCHTARAQQVGIEDHRTHVTPYEGCRSAN